MQCYAPDPAGDIGKGGRRKGNGKERGKGKGD